MILNGEVIFSIAVRKRLYQFQFRRSFHDYGKTGGAAVIPLPFRDAGFNF